MTALNDHCTIAEDGKGTVRLTISNAGKANILSSQVIDALLAGLDQLSRRPELRALVLSGTGDRTFIGGAHIGEMVGLDQQSGERFISRLRDLCEAVRLFPTPVVARVAGWCLGGGLELAMACDLRIASSAAQFAMPEVKVGIPSVIHAALMPRLIGSGRTRWMILTGEPIDAATALQWGLVDQVADLAALDTAIETTLAPILACGPEVIRAQKVLLRQWDELPLAQAIEAGVPAFGRAFATGEPQRFMQAFLDHKGR
ncbi:enoyl-CoA hydratase [Phreatobacter stygius]|uniref:Enoyl-CoA hydratase n=1 Tax=Phreatobacter stygius TaxID=1940610 RepID=A0A4D7B5A4_9HYPH|nr:enoyl-CoA hydratase [Phreatobacter stygius]QCI68574.1 enoyl-CoA hydratase [Phreatobacter stygius]